MSRGLDYGGSYDNRWDTSSPIYVHRDPINTYDVPQSRNVYGVFDDNREDQPFANYYYPAERVVFEEDHHSVPVHKNHRHASKEPRKHVHFVEHEEKVIESFDNFGNSKVHKESVDGEADWFIKRKHKNFELNKSGTFNSFY